MINEYLLKIKIEGNIEEELDEYNLKKYFLYVALISLKDYFKFNLKGIQTSEKSIGLYYFLNETDWIFKDTKTFNFFYPLDVEKADLIAIYKNQLRKINIEKNHLYVFPYWMTYKFVSQEKDFKQIILQGGLDTVDRPFFKKMNKRW